MENPENKKKKTRVSKVTKTTVTKTTEVKVKAERKPRTKKEPKVETKLEAPIKPVDEHIDDFSAKLTVGILLVMLVVLIVWSVMKKETPKPMTIEPQANMILKDTVAKDTMVTVLDTGKVDTIVTANK